MNLYSKITPWVVAAYLLAMPFPCRAAVTVSVQVTLAGVAVGGVAWALSVVWWERVGLVAKALTSPPPLDPLPEPQAWSDLKAFFPLLVIPLP